jgi:competence protein ComGC
LPAGIIKKSGLRVDREMMQKPDNRNVPYHAMFIVLFIIAVFIFIFISAWKHVKEDMIDFNSGLTRNLNARLRDHFN